MFIAIRWLDSHPYSVKDSCISTDILWRVFCILTEPVPYTFVSVNRRNNETRAHILATNYPCTDIRIFFTVWATYNYERWEEVQYKQ